VTLLLYLGAVVSSGYLFPPGEKSTAFVLASIVLSGLLVMVAWATGEPPRWRWGKKSDLATTLPSFK
jgi:hypothetical protein